MKKLIVLGLLMVSGMVFVPTVEAQYQDRNRGRANRQDDCRQNDRRDRRNRRGIYRRHQNYTYTVVNEYRYVRLGRRLYREIYRCTYDPYGRLVSRMLVGRERVRRYEHYNREMFTDNDISFNIFIGF